MKGRGEGFRIGKRVRVGVLVAVVNGEGGWGWVVENGVGRGF